MSWAGRTGSGHRALSGLVAAFLVASATTTAGCGDTGDPGGGGLVDAAEGPPDDFDDGGVPDHSGRDGGPGDDAGGEDDDCDPGTFEGTPFAAAVVEFDPGPGAGFGQEGLPCIVLGAPRGAGSRAGSLDVVSLGAGGAITLRLGIAAVDQPGPDLLVFENPFVLGAGPDTFAEPGQVEVSEDGETFQAFPCDADDREAGYPGCAGVRPVLAGPGAPEIDPTEPTAAGGDAFDLAELGLDRASFVRITDRAGTGGGMSSGFDLDAIAVVQSSAP
jgi:hypothetical protein